jgi:hypothetical protein
MGLTIYETDSPEQMTNLEALHAMWSSEVKTMNELFPDPHGDRIQLVSNLPWQLNIKFSSARLQGAV